MFKKVIAPLHFEFRNVEKYTLKKECSFKDAINMHHNRDRLLMERFVLWKNEQGNFPIEKNQVMFVHHQDNDTTRWDYFYIEGDGRNYFICAYAWNKNWISLFPRLEKKEFNNAYDLQSFRFPVVNGLVAFGEKTTILKDRIMTYEVRVTRSDDWRYLRDYYTNFIKLAYKGAKVKKLDVRFTENDSGMHSYAGTTLYDMKVTVEFHSKEKS